MRALLHARRHFSILSAHESPKIPSLMFKFPSNNSFVIQNPTFLIYGNQGVVGFCLAVQPTDGDVGIIGQNFMTGYRMVFDRENLKLGWSRSDCQDLSDKKRLPLTPPPDSRPANPLPTNEQQSTPSGQAVAPAVAGRAPSKPSAAAPQLAQSGFCFVRLLPPLLLLCLWPSELNTQYSWFIYIYIVLVVLHVNLDLYLKLLIASSAAHLYFSSLFGHWSD